VAGEGGDEARAGDAAMPTGGVASGGKYPTGGAGGTSGSAPLEGGAGGSGVVELQPPEPFVAVDCYPGFTMEEEGLSFDGRFAAVLAMGPGAEPTGLALIDRESGVPQTIATASTDLDPPSIAGDASRLLYGAGLGNTSRAYIWERASEEVVADYLVGDLVTGALSFDGRFLGFRTRDAAITSPPPNFQGGAVVVDIDSGNAILASITPSGASATRYSSFVDISDDGQRVVFASPATDIAPGKTGNSWDVYLHTRGGPTSLLSRRPDGGFADAYSYRPRISGDGHIVTFESGASDILEGDVADTPDVIVIEVDTGLTVSPTVQQLGTNTVQNLSRDGRFIVFSSNSALAPGDGNAAMDALVYDRLLDKTEVASVDRTGAPLSVGAGAVAISGDGNVVAFVTASPELVEPNQLGVLCFAARTPIAND
jgi:hypothetical protein